MKDRIATYIVNGVDRNADDTRLVRHAADCQFLVPCAFRPDVADRKATPQEMTQRRACRVC